MTIDTLIPPSEPSAEVPAVVLDAEAGGSLPTLSAEDVGWMMRSIRDAQSRIAETLATHAKYVAKLEAEIAMVYEAQHAAVKSDIDKCAYLEAQLTAHLLNQRAADDKVKSIETPWGRVTSRVQQPEYKRDDAALLEWALVYDDFTRMKTTTSIDWERLKAACHVRDGKLVTSDGEVVPGVEVIERGPKVSVEVID